MFDLNSRVALVTGAATGLGASISSALARSGADVVVTDKPGVSVDETAANVERVGRRSLRQPIDVRDVSQIRDGIQAAIDAFGKIDILVSNAGINRPTTGLEVTEEEWDDHFNTNVKGGFFVAQAAARHMIARNGGRIVFISSQSGLVGIAGQPVYCSTKGALIQLTRTLGLEWAKHGITVNNIAPTFVETNLTRARLENPEFLRFVKGKIPCGKLATPKDIAAAAVYLASDEAGMVNCATLCVDGGWTAW